MYQMYFQLLLLYWNRRRAKRKLSRATVLQGREGQSLASWEVRSRKLLTQNPLTRFTADSKRAMWHVTFNNNKKAGTLKCCNHQGVWRHYHRGTLTSGMCQTYMAFTKSCELNKSTIQNSKAYFGPKCASLDDIQRQRCREKWKLTFQASF